MHKGQIYDFSHIILLPGQHIIYGYKLRYRWGFPSTKLTPILLKGTNC